MDKSEAFFAVAESTSSEKCLAELGSQDDIIASAGVRIVARASSAKPSVLRCRRADGTIAHVGDVIVGRSCNARSIVVTGSLTIRGRLSNWEGCSVYVGGALTADAVATEGPLWVGGDLVAKRAVFATYNDHRMRVDGRLTTPVLVEDDHVVEIGTRRVGRHYRSKRSVPPEVAKKLVRALGLRRWSD